MTLFTFSSVSEGVDSVFARHKAVHEQLVAGLEALNWKMLVDEPFRLPQLNTVVVPDGVDEAALRSRLLNEYNIEVGNGLGDLSGKVIRIGLMGYNAQSYNVERLLAAMKEILA